MQRAEKFYDELIEEINGRCEQWVGEPDSLELLEEGAEQWQQEKR